MTDEPTESDNEHFRISNLVFSSGNQTSDTNYDVHCGNVVILVGPNNSGKSTMLKEIEDYCLGGNKELKVLSDIRFNVPLTEDGIRELVDAFRVETYPVGYNIQAGEFLLSIPDVKGQGEQPQYQKIEPVSIENCSILFYKRKWCNLYFIRYICFNEKEPKCCFMMNFL